MTRPNPYGTRAEVASRDDPIYQRMAENALAVLRRRMTEHEYAAWKYRAFERHGETMQNYTWCEIMMAANMEINHPAECKCHDGSCPVCQSYAHAQTIEY